tara:strand:- start:2741 stop:3562 length:822 start_codon:yes stop_codon:yes gene_type:complete
MELMLDSANLEEIRRIKALGLLGGLTTNPLIIRKGIQEMDYQGDFYTLAKEILKQTGDTPCFFQTTGHTVDEMTERAKRIYGKLREYGNPHIKVPFNPSLDETHNSFAGIETLSNLRKEGIPTLATAIVTPSQAYFASQAGADYAVLMLRPYDNIIAEEAGIELDEREFFDDTSAREVLDKKGIKSNDYISGIGTLRAASKMFSTRDLETKLIIAGIRNPIQFDEAASENGVSAVTLPYSVFLSILPHEGTRRFVDQTYSGSPKIYKEFIEDD